MRILAKVTPSTKITARLSINSNVRRYTSLVQVRNKQWKNNCHSKLQSRTFYEADQYKVGTKTFNKSNELEQTGGLQSTILPIALIDLNPLSSKSSKVLLIPLNWNDSDEYAVRNTVTSIFSKSKNLKQIEAFSQALKSVPSYKNVENKPAAAEHANEKKDLLPVAKVKNFSNSLELEQKNVDVMKVGNLNMNLDNLARAVDKTLQQCCLHCMQISSDNQIIGEKIKLFTAPIQTAQLTAAENIKLTSLFKINGSDINLGDFTWQRKIPFPELQSTSLTNITFPTALKKKSFSAKTIPSLMQPKLLCAPSDSLQKCTDSTAIKPNARSASSNVPSSKGVNKCNFTFLSNLFGTDNLLMSCDAYNKALIEASKRKAALAESLMQGKQSEMNNFKRPKVINIKGCTALEQNLSSNSQSATNASKPCPPPAKPTKIAKGGGCKKDDPCKPTTCPDPCKEEMEKLQRLKEEEMNRKRKKVPTGCVSPKCKKEDGCTKLKKGPSKKASGRINKNCSKMQMKGNLKKLRSSNRLRKSLQCTQKGKNTSCGKGKDKKQENPCADEHKEYKPKCNADPCKKQEPPCGGSTKKKADSGGCKKDDPCKKKEDPCKKKEDPCKKKSPCGSKKEDPCKRKDPCGSKKEDPCKKKDPCGSKKEDPCKKKDPCGSKKEDPCKKKDPCGSKKEDPCKKKDPCGSKKEDPCKKKDPCGSKKEDPCKKKPSSPCKSKKPKGSSTNCGKQKGPTKPSCKKSYSTLCLVENHIAGSPIKRAYSSLTALLPQIKNKHFFSNGFMRRFSSKKDGKNSKKDYGKSSQCKIDATKVPPKRKPAYNPHTKDGIRQCFPTYDMDCKKLCKDPRKTSCKKFAFLKDTDNNKRDGRK